MTPATPDSLLLLGRCGRPHGVRGELVVVPEIDEPALIAGLERLYIGGSVEDAIAYPVESARLHVTKRGTAAIVQFGGIGSPDEARALQGQAVYAAEDELPPLEEGELYVHDLIGLRAVLEDGTAVGEVVDVLRGAAQDLLVIRRPAGDDVLVPDVPEIVPEIDPEAGTVTLTPPEGLLD